jgi:hypothetical protein
MNFQLLAISRRLSVALSKVQDLRSQVRDQKLREWGFGAKGWKHELLGANCLRLFPFSVSFLYLFASVSFLCLCLPACGKKTPVRPPAFVLPEPTGDLTLDIAKSSVVLRWGRPQEYVDGSEMEDLSGFVVFRATQDVQGKTSPFAKIATIPVEDRDRFRKTKRFTYTDTQLTAGTLYRYRVQSLTADGYESELSNTVELVWKGG